MHVPRPLVIAGSVPFYRLGLNARLPITLGRRIIAAGAVPSVPPPGTVVRHITLGGRPAERVTVGASERPRAILYLHGGGYTVASARVYRGLAIHLARAAEAVVYNLDYRLAPEHVYPAALDDAVAAFRELADEYGADRVAISGDSAGGGLAVATARRLTDAGLRPAALGLLSPWTDPADDDFRVTRARGTNRAWGKLSAVLYRGDADPHDPGYAPMYADLRGLPPMLIHTAPSEMLYDQVRRFAAKARAAGIDVELVEDPAWWHSVHVTAGILREATDAVTDVGRYLARHLRTHVDVNHPSMITHS